MVAIYSFAYLGPIEQKAWGSLSFNESVYSINRLKRLCLLNRIREYQLSHKNKQKRKYQLNQSSGLAGLSM